ncbi:hypothetical protein V6R21_21595 [Limibacter armeniacum]|uniref:hypothetical protein n=1 Tax=Limibacter armeniacum TaxID=466084 RepID=UPI002FE5ED1A
MKVRLVETPYFIAVLNKKLCIVEIYWKEETKGFTDEVYKESFFQLAELITQHEVGAIYVLATFFEFIIGVDLQEWHDQVIFPMLVKGGVKKIAIVNCSEFVTKLSIEQIFETSDSQQSFSTNFFNNEIQARIWLIDKQWV